MKDIISGTLCSIEIDEIISEAKKKNTPPQYVKEICAKFTENFNENNQSYKASHFFVNKKNGVVINTRNNNNYYLVYYVYAPLEHPSLNEKILNFLEITLNGEQKLKKCADFLKEEISNKFIKACYVIFITAYKYAWQDSDTENVQQNSKREKKKINAMRLRPYRKFTSEEMKQILDDNNVKFEFEITESKKYTCNWCNFENSGQGYKFLIFEVK